MVGNDGRSNPSRIAEVSTAGQDGKNDLLQGGADESQVASQVSARVVQHCLRSSCQFAGLKVIVHAGTQLCATGFFGEPSKSYTRNHL